MADPADPLVTTTKGPPKPGTKPGGAPEPIDPDTGMHGAYWILTEEERAKGFVRPVRTKYVHKGIRPEHPTRPLTAEEQGRFEKFKYVSFEAYPDAEETGTTGRYWTQAQLDSGCGTVTVMGKAIAETYARKPGFYGSTFCGHCGDHFVLEQFTWDGTDEVVGS